MDFLIFERLAAKFVLGCGFCDEVFEAIGPRQIFVELDDRS